ncbi:MAG: pseudouridine synthase [Terracidiphilus sp.]
MPKKTEKKAAAATASAGEKQPAKVELIIEAVPELEPKAKKTRATKADPARGASASAEKAPVESAPQPAAVSNEAALDPAAPPAKKKRASTKARAAKVAIESEAGAAVNVTLPAGAPISNPVGYVSDGAARTAEDAAGSTQPSESEALAEALAEEIKSNEASEYVPQAAFVADSVLPAKLERLQKILAQAGIASRRRAEEMIVEGRVMVNGQVVTQLGAKADPARDHIRVDGKLIAGAERQRYFVLNKPRGYVTTVSDPEGRPTVMQFFEKMQQRLYPVGRLDYLSEGLLLVTNDGELANQLTRASLGVEKTYLVKVAGKPTEEELDRLRSGVSIERGGPGSERVGTAPAAIRQVRQGDNPWYEVVLIEGRNRELRKMFEQIGHFVEKIRRVGYGPLVLDVEPGKFRELTAEEVKALQLTAEGKLKPRRTKAMPTVPKDAGHTAGDRTVRSGGGKTFGNRPGRAPAGRPGRTFDGPPRGKRPETRPAFEGRRPERGAKPAFKPRFDNRSAERFGGRAQFTNSEGEQRGESRPFESRRGSAKPIRGRENLDSGRAQRFEGRNTGFRPQQRNQESAGEDSPQREFGPRGDKPQFRRGGIPAFKPGGKPEFKRSERPAFRPGSPGASKRAGQSKFRSERPAFDRGSKPAFDRSIRPTFDRGAKPAFKRSERPPFKRDEGQPFQRRGEAGGNLEGRPSRPPGRTFGARPAGKPGARSSGAKFSGGTSSGRKFGAGASRKPGSRPGGKFNPQRGDRKR